MILHGFHQRCRSGVAPVGIENICTATEAMCSLTELPLGRRTLAVGRKAVGARSGVPDRARQCKPTAIAVRAFDPATSARSQLVLT